MERTQIYSEPGLLSGPGKISIFYPFMQGTMLLYIYIYSYKLSIVVEFEISIISLHCESGEEDIVHSNAM